MAKKRPTSDKRLPIAGAAMLRRVFPMLAALAASGTARDKANNRRLLFSQYAGLVLIGLFNPLLNSARALVAASGLKAVRRLTGGRKTSLGSFSEAVSVFEPRLLEGLIRQLQSQAHRQRGLARAFSGGRVGDLPDKLIERLIAVDGSVLTALPQLVNRLGRVWKGQWRLHACVHVCDQTLVASRLTEEPAARERSERDVLAQLLSEGATELADAAEGHLFLLDRGYRSASLFNTIHQAGHDYVCRLNRRDGRVVPAPPTDARGRKIEPPPLSDAARELGVVADELITLGGSSGASPIGTDQPVRRVRLIPPEGRASAARQGRPRANRNDREELILATTLLDLPAEQIVQIYEHRWQVELFFRFLKHVLKCDQLLSTKTAGVQIQLYCALIASLLIALATGGNLTRRNFEMICLYFSGWADEEELLDALGRPP